MTVDPEMTVTPPATTVVRTVAVWTATMTELLPPAVRVVWDTAYARCTVPVRVKDPLIHRPLPTPGPALNKAVVPSNRNSQWGHKEKRGFLKRRDSKHGLVKRAQDVPVVTFTDTNTANWGTTTVTDTAPALVVTDFVTTWDNVVVTPTPVTIVAGESTAPLVRVVLPQSTRYINHYTIARIIKTVVPTCTYVPRPLASLTHATDTP
jgi:hypothetical protein